MNKKIAWVGKSPGKRESTVELKGYLNSAIIIGVILGLLAILISFGWYEDTQKLKSQLQKCEENMPIWTLTYTCHYPDFNYNNTITMDFDSEREYQIHIKHLSEASAKHCKIIE